MEFGSTSGEQEYAALVRAADDLVVGLDFDGTLAPIVEDPEHAHIHPDAGEVLVDLAAQVRAVAVITGRPARQALDLGGLEEVGNAIGESGRELFVLGQYGNERWTSTDRRVISPKPPRGLATFMGELPRLLRDGPTPPAPGSRRRGSPSPCTRAGSTTRRRPSSGCCRCSPRRRGATTSTSSPGAQVIEVRAHGMHKGAAVRRLAEELGAKAFVFCGDDLGDVEAFKAVEELRGEGFPACWSARARRSRTRSPSWPTSWSTARTAYSTCCAS